MGTDAWRNWLARNDGEPESENVDEDVYSDRRFTGTASPHGPYALSLVFGDAPDDHRVGMHLALKLHVSIHADLAPEVVRDGQLVPANSDSYHGGSQSDEIVALISLALGVRLRVAGTSRFSGRHSADSNARPFYLEVPALMTPGKPGREYIPAAQRRTTDVTNLEILDTFPRLSETDQIALVRAARAYAQGLWLSNEDPNQAWLQFVTAMEIAASRSQKVKASSVALVQDLWPELWAALAGADEDVRSGVCKQAAPLARSTRRFIDFISANAPAPPEHRPPYGQLDWNLMEEHAKLIYGHRSRALHDGKPFPLPMLDWPRWPDDEAIQEVPLGLNTGGMGGVWDASEAPMLLSTFEHIVRGALLTWWGNLLPKTQAREASAQMETSAD
jgi:hypothetical protein